MHVIQGVLTVNLIRCINLVGENPNVSVRLLASDDEKEQEFRCVQLINSLFLYALCL